jgi:peroxiredoxin
MIKLLLKSILLITFCFIVTPIKSQWRYPNADKIEKDVIITYKVEYDNVLSEKQKKSISFKKDIIVYFNNNKLVEITFTGKNDHKKVEIIDYKKEKYYSGSIYKTYKRLIVEKLKPGKEVTKLENVRKENLLNISCDVYTKSNSTKKILTTKKFGIRYSKNYNCDGFLLKYMGRTPLLGTYTVTATKIEYVKVPKNLYRLYEYTITTKEEQELNSKKWRKKYEEKKVERKQIEYKKVGTKTLPFSARSITRKKIKSKDLLGKIIVVNFWYTNSYSFKKAIPQLNKLKKDFTGKNIEFLAFSRDLKYKIEEFLKTNTFNFDIVEDAGWLAEKFDVENYPTYIIINKQGIITYQKSGYIKDIYKSMSYQIDKLLKQ